MIDLWFNLWRHLSLFINDVITPFASHSNFSSWEIEMMRCFAFCSSSSFECIVNKRWTLVFIVKGKELQPMTFQWSGALWSWTLVQSFNQPLCVGVTEENSHVGLNRGEDWANHKPLDWWLENVQLQRLLSLWTNVFLLLSWQTWNYYYYYYWWTNHRSNNSCKKQASQNLNSIPTLKSIKTRVSSQNLVRQSQNNLILYTWSDGLVGKHNAIHHNHFILHCNIFTWSKIIANKEGLSKMGCKVGKSLRQSWSRKGLRSKGKLKKERMVTRIVIDASKREVKLWEKALHPIHPKSSRDTNHIPRIVIPSLVL